MIMILIMKFVALWIVSAILACFVNYVIRPPMTEDDNNDSPTV